LGSRNTDLSDWLSIDNLPQKDCNYLQDSVILNLSTEKDRIDIRKDKGFVKFIFKNHFTALQLDGVTGNILHVEIRRADFLEKLHDGSIIDYYLGIKSDLFKLIYTTIMGLALFTFTLTCVWLWYGPIRMRNTSRGN